MRSFISLLGAALLLTMTLANGAAAQQSKSQTKARKVKTAKVKTPAPLPAPANPVVSPPPPPRDAAQARPANPPVLSTPTPGDGAPRITPAELRVALDNGTAILVDVRGDDSYKAGHIKGAISIPVDEIRTRFKELPKDKFIATYCS
jgi:hypothetical protein